VQKNVDSRDEPFVSVVTPAYNAEPYLADCIRSVLAQTYSNWEYIVVNNCSTDLTQQIVERYASEDKRVRVIRNAAFVGAIANHNIACRQISAQSRYCKIVSADDWIEPNCLRKMVECGERYPTTGIIGAYQLSNQEVLWRGLPTDVSLQSGREACRLGLLKGIHVLGAPTSVLYRSELVRSRTPFFPHEGPHADTSACYASLDRWDFGFVHEVLSHERVHPEQISSNVRKQGAGTVALIETLLEYGPRFLTADELKTRQAEVLGEYHRWLAGCLLKMEGRAFWKFHSARMKQLGCPIDWRKVLAGTVQEIWSELSKPTVAFRKAASILRAKFQS